MEAICKICGGTKDVHEFRKHHKEGPYELWNLRQCKECTHKEYLARYANKEKRLAQRAASSNWKKNNPEKHAEINKQYYQKNIEKAVAQARLRYAVKTGRVNKAPCEKCGATERIHGHHYISYKPEDWYNVRWLCFRCHKFEHAPPEYLFNSG